MWVLSISAAAERQRKMVLEQRHRVSASLLQQQQQLQQDIRLAEASLKRQSRCREEQRRLMKKFDAQCDDIPFVSAGRKP